MLERFSYFNFNPQTFNTNHFENSASQSNAKKKYNILSFYFLASSNQFVQLMPCKIVLFTENCIDTKNLFIEWKRP